MTHHKSDSCACEGRCQLTVVVAYKGAPLLYTTRGWLLATVVSLFVNQPKDNVFTSHVITLISFCV